MQPHLSLSQLPLFLCDIILRQQICTFLPLVRCVVFVPQDHCVSAKEVGKIWTHTRTPPHSFYFKRTMLWSNIHWFRKTSWYCSLWFQGFYLTFQKQKLQNCILMDCQWFCDSFLAMCLTCWGSLGKFSVQESPLYGSSLSQAFQSNEADSEPHLHQICLRSGKRQKEMFFSTDINWLCPILVLLH